MRRSAIDSYDPMMTMNVGIARFVETHLGYHHAVPAIARLAKTAPTKTERDEATDYVRAFKTQPEMLSPER